MSNEQKVSQVDKTERKLFEAVSVDKELPKESGAYFVGIKFSNGEESITTENFDSHVNGFAGQRRTKTLYWLKPLPPQQLSDSEVDLESEFKNDFEYFLKRSDNRLQYQSNKGLRLSELKALWMLGYKAAHKSNDSEMDNSNEPYFGWCDVEGCEKEGANGGNCWRETGYWTVCLDHSASFREGESQPKMKDYAIFREESRGEDGILKYTKTELLTKFRNR